MPTPEQTRIHATRQDGVLLLGLNHPPLNTLDHALRQQLHDALHAAALDASVQAIVLHGAGGNFSAGADIREFDQPRQPPWAGDVALLISASAKPVVAALQGVALGGGLELALAAHARVGTADARLGLPEVKLGLVPGGGGTQRLPRLIGAEAALPLMLEGRNVDGNAALALGLLDEVCDGPVLLDAAVRKARALREGALARPDRIDDAGRQAGLAAVAAQRQRLAAKPHALPAQRLLLDCVAAALEQPLEAGLRFEREAFLQCVASPEHRGLAHAFFAERLAGKSPAGAARPRPVQKVGVVGGGTMGAGIAVAMLDAGLDVVLIERDAASLQAGQDRIGGVYQRQLDAGRLDAAARARRLARLSAATDYAALAEADLVVEAVFEEMEVKARVYAELDRVCRPGAILATNTSYLDIDQLARRISRPQDVIGLHFFSPANVMKLLEIVVPGQVADDVVATGFALARRLGKVPVRAGVCDGFIGNRILYVYREAANFMMEDGASPYQIDQALERFGYAMGPFRTADLTGGDIGWATRKRKAATRPPEARYVRVADRLCERGWFGQKTGRGYYRYPERGQRGQHDPEVLALIDDERAARGVAARPFSDEEIVRRYMAALVNEAAKVLEDGIALRPADIDAALVNGYGFPRWRGGPMKYADDAGLPAILADLESYAKEDPRFWAPSELLRRLAREGSTFGKLNRQP
ncbi:MAG: 3-hydroxyacyl-CoA dehydrogenase NAD-binding domain-containing protein [Achromobacter sp.]|uniref:3-hydroxyacyl-CoA dehydrogenase NAD-binding domain-containing protein n=1 Tax=Achromobacter sp. TaxID=134375 RepID=UPI00258486D5|nr:3-hydroxyacyl-CoA dehydrogenase NAD-binding domain-containing protein [Achromobacter sp.]MCW0207267.1 3-hydroxyacyl-CoA dehydrogenase NAD-binding domain-containing protein [Achromobacter sp.]